MFQVSKGEAFTVARELTVNVSKMYQLISGLYIPANTQFFEFAGKVETTPAPKPAKKRYSLPTATLRRGSKGKDVGLLQTAFNAANFKVGSVDDDFGKKTEAAVKRFQKVYLPREVEGIAGPYTYRELNKVINK